MRERREGRRQSKIEMMGSVKGRKVDGLLVEWLNARRESTDVTTLFYR